jgi:hypothetical protein
VNQTKSSTSPWDSLEIVKVLVSCITPLVVALMGVLIQASIAQQSEASKLNSQLAARRLVVYDGVREGLNRIYCFVEDRGSWKTDNPDTITALRRKIQTDMQTNRAIWSPKTFTLYERYIDEVAFKTYTGVGRDAQIRTVNDQKEVAIPDWKKKWKDRTTDEKAIDHKASYDALQDQFARDIQLSSDSLAQQGGLRHLLSFLHP